MHHSSLILPLIIGNLLYIAPLIVGIVVYLDARNIGIRKGLMPGFFNMGAGMWSIACFLILIIALPLYLFKRGQYKQIIEQIQAQAVQQDSEASGVWPPPPHVHSDQS